MLDVENYERQVIDGALKTIEKFKPVICIEKSFLPANDIAIEQKLAAFGYSRVAESPTDIFFKI
jgi:Methyltransferase FkbM domain